MAAVIAIKTIVRHHLVQWLILIYDWIHMGRQVPHRPKRKGLGVEPHGLQAVAPLESSATPRRSVPSFAKVSEDTRYAFLHGLLAMASCEGG